MKLWYLSTCKKSNRSLTGFFWGIVKTLQTYFGNFGNAWPSPKNHSLPISRKLSWISTCIKLTSSLILFYFDIAKQTRYFGQFENAWPHTAKLILSIWRNFVFICRQKIIFILHVFFDILQRYGKLVYFRYFGHARLWTPKVTLSICRKLLCLSAGRRSTYCKDMQTSYFGYFGHARLWKPKMIV